MSGRIIDASTEAVPASVDCEVCIVGSGSGGATAAWELAKAGRDVVVLEEGGDFLGPALTMRDGMYDQLYMDRGGRATDDMAISVLQGRVLGGGGVINASDVVPIADGVLRCWQKKFGLVDFSPEALAPFKKQALEDLSANVPTELNENNRIAERGAKVLGWRGEVMSHNRQGCIGLGKCMVGCRVNAKRNPRLVAIPAAIAAGARFFLRVRAVRVEGASSEMKTVRARALDAKGYHERGELQVRAKTVILAANAVASAELLLRSGLGNDHVGRHLSLQPQLPIVSVFDHEVRSFRGIPQSYAVTEFESLEDDAHGWWGFRIEPISVTPGISASILPKLGHVGKELMSRFAHFAASLLLVPDEGNGRVTLDRGRARISYVMPDEQKRRYRDAIKAAARMYLAAGAKEVTIPTARPLVIRAEADLAAVDALGFEPATAPFISAHQQGTVRFATSEKDGGANPAGEVYGTRGVYVLDSSGFPTSASSHTMTPIMTVSRFLARRLAAEMR
jgi:choline dehydrogenase-like flavoprotein